MGRYRQQGTKDTFSDTMGEQDSYKETFAFWLGNIQLTKVSGSDHSGAFTIGWRGQVDLQYTMGEWTCLQV